MITGLKYTGLGIVWRLLLTPTPMRTSSIIIIIIIIIYYCTQLLRGIY